MTVLETGRSILLAVVGLSLGSAAVAADAYTLDFSTYSGSTGRDTIHGDMTADGAGNVYVVGHTDSPGFPVTSGAYKGGASDSFVAKYDAAGVKQWAYFLGTSSFDYAINVDLDPTETYLYVAGRCGPGLSTTPGVLQPSYGGYDNGIYGETNGCIFRLRASDGSLDAATYWGTASSVRDLNVCANGDVVVCQGYDGSNGQGQFPSAWSSGRYRPGPVGNVDVYVGKISADLRTVRWGTYVGGSAREELGSNCDCDGNNAVVVGVCTQSADMDVSPAGYDTTYGSNGSNGNVDGYIAKLNATGTSLLWGTYHGGTSWDCPGSKHGVAVNSVNDVVVGGGTQSSDMSTTAGAYDRTHNGGNDIHVAVLGGSNGALLAATFFGGTLTDGTEGVKVGRTDDEIYIAASTNSTNMPTTAGAYDSTLNGGTDGILVKFNRDLGQLLYSSYMGTSSDDTFRAISDGPNKQFNAAGETSSGSWPTRNADQSTYGGGSLDAMIVQFEMGTASAPPPPPQNVYRTDQK